MRKIDRTHAEHFQWNQVCDGWHFLKRDELSVIVEKVPPHTTEQMHYHCKSKQFFYILSGTAVMDFECESFDLEIGDAIEVEPMEIHRISNRSDSPVEFIMISSPTAHGDKVDVIL